MMVFLVTRLPAPMMQSLPILAPSRIMAPIPIKVRSPIVQLWITALWPIVTLFPIYWQASADVDCAVFLDVGFLTDYDWRVISADYAVV